MIRILVAASAAAIVQTAGAAAEDRLIPQADYEMTTKITDGDSGSAIPMQMRHHDGKLRMETSFEGQSAAILMDIEAQTATVLIDAQGMRMAMDMPANEAVDVPQAPAGTHERIGSDTVAGEPCDIYRVTDPDSGEQGDMCMTKDNIVLRIDRATGETVYEAETFERAPQDPSLFVVPAGYQRMHMGGAMLPPQ